MSVFLFQPYIGETVVRNVTVGHWQACLFFFQSNITVEIDMYFSGLFFTILVFIIIHFYFYFYILLFLFLFSWYTLLLCLEITVYQYIILYFRQLAKLNLAHKLCKLKKIKFGHSLEAYIIYYIVHRGIGKPTY